MINEVQMTAVQWMLSVFWTLMGGHRAMKRNLPVTLFAVLVVFILKGH